MTSLIPHLAVESTGTFKRQVAVCEAEHEVLPLLAEVGPHLSSLHDGGPVVGVHDLVPDIKRHTSPKRP